jgi:hypothetical protein
MSEFMWKKVSEKDRDEIRRKAKGIMDDFAGKLESYESKLKDEAVVERDKCERGEDDKADCANGFDKKIMIENAPESEGDFIVSDRGILG